MKHYRVRVSSLGELTLPETLREQLHVEAGGELTIQENEGRFTIDNVEQRVRFAQALVRKYIAPGSSIVDELIADRRAEAERE